MKPRATLLPLLVLVASALAQNSITIKTITAMQGFNPLNPAAIGHPVITGKSQLPDQLLGSFTVTNYSAKTVSSLTYGWRISAPLSCQSNLRPFWQEEKVSVEIKPQANITLDGPKDLNEPGTSKRLAEMADVHKAQVVLVTVGLLEVNYADGSIWRDEDAIRSRSFDRGVNEKTDLCAPPKAKVGAQNNCGQRSLKDFLADKDIDRITAKGGGGGLPPCYNTWCNPLSIYFGSCPFEFCEIQCCGLGCSDECYGFCDTTFWPERCHTQYP